MNIWTYRHDIDVNGRAYRIEASVSLKQFCSRLYLDERLLEEQSVLFSAGYHNICHELVIANGESLEIEVGYVNWLAVGVVVRNHEVVVFESHPGKDIHFAEKQPLLAALPVQDAEVARENAERWERNKYSVFADLCLGALFFVVGKLTGDLALAALIGAGAGLLLVLLQRFVRVDLLGGFAVFGTIMLLISAAFSLAFQSDFMVQMKSSVLGVLTAVLFLGDGLLRGGEYFGTRMQRYMPAKIDVARMAFGLGLLGLVTAALNYAIARWFSEDVWLNYTTFVDMPVSIALAYAVFFWARVGAKAD